VTVGMCQEAVDAYLKVTKLQCRLNLIIKCLSCLYLLILTWPQTFCAVLQM